MSMSRGQIRYEAPKQRVEAPLPAPEIVASPYEDLPELDLLKPGPDAAPKDDLNLESVPKELDKAVEFWLQRHSRNSTEAARNLRKLAAAEPERMVDILLSLHEMESWGSSTAFLERLLTGISATAARLCDPAMPFESAVRIARALAQRDTQFDACFAKRLLEDDQIDEPARQRGMAVLQKIGTGFRLVPILIQFLRDPDSRIRSKAALMFGQSMPSQAIMERLMGDQNARVRANFIEGLWNCPASGCCQVFRLALQDPAHRVAGNALVGLHKLGETREVMKHLDRMARSPDAAYRAVAAWVMGQTGDDHYRVALRQMSRDPDRGVRFNALRSVCRINGAQAKK